LTSTFLSEVVSRVCIYKYGTSIPPYHFLIPIHIILYSNLFGQIPGSSHLFRECARWMGFLIAVIAIALSLRTGIFQYPTYANQMMALIIVAGALFGFAFMINRPETELLRNPWFWFNMGTLLFFALTFFIFSFLEPVLRRTASMPDWTYDLVMYANFLLYGAIFTSLILLNSHNAIEQRRR